LADSLPGQEFLAVASWGTTDRDLGELAARPNITVRPSVDDVEEIYGQTKVLMMPSLWDETFGYACVEAMLRGIPVLAADVAGLREAKLGVDYLLPVRPIPVYARSTPLALPDAQPPSQDLAPWRSALRRLTGDPEHHRQVSEQSLMAAEDFVARLDADAVERYLFRLSAGMGAAR
jgi:glycosyltransferase involved in cell wall biosynthesis